MRWGLDGIAKALGFDTNQIPATDGIEDLIIAIQSLTESCFGKLGSDLRDHTIPRDVKGALSKVKCKITHGCRVYWYFNEDAAFFKREKVSARQYAGYSGLVVLAPDAECGGGEIDFEKAVLIVDRYPCEKCSPEVDYVAFKRFLDNEDLVEVFWD